MPTDTTAEAGLRAGMLRSHFAPLVGAEPLITMHEDGTATLAFRISAERAAGICSPPVRAWPCTERMEFEG